MVSSLLLVLFVLLGVVVLAALVVVVAVMVRKSDAPAPTRPPSSPRTARGRSSTGRRLMGRGRSAADAVRAAHLAGSVALRTS
jgi:hypothetical protein